MTEQKRQLAEHVGFNLLLLRYRADLTQEELGALVGLPQSRISVFESGETLPKLDQFLRLVEVLRIGPSQLLERAWNE
jgi:transcriptional regulator with XRE-family HTH domain